MGTLSFGLDHIVALSADLDGAAAQYSRLGFTVAPQMHHPFGTANRMVIFERNFLELVGIARPNELSGPGQLVADCLATNGPGAYGVALRSEDIAADRERLATRGLRPGAVGGGRRPVTLPGGTEGEARFSTVLIPSPPPLARLFVFLAQQHVPEVIWIPAWQRHANGARRLQRVTIAVPEPRHLVPFLTALFGGGSLSVEGDALTAMTPLGTLEVIAGAEAARRYEGTTTPEGGSICAAAIEVADLAATRRRIETAGIATFSDGAGQFLVRGADAAGLVLEFCTPA